MVEVLPVVFSIGVWSRALYIHIAMTSSTCTHKLDQDRERERAVVGCTSGFTDGSRGRRDCSCWSGNVVLIHTTLSYCIVIVLVQVYIVPMVCWLTGYDVLITASFVQILVVRCNRELVSIRSIL
jgi:hypothetical protein